MYVLIAVCAPQGGHGEAHLPSVSGVGPTWALGLSMRKGVGREREGPQGLSSPRPRQNSRAVRKPVRA